MKYQLSKNAVISHIGKDILLTVCGKVYSINKDAESILTLISEPMDVDNIKCKLKAVNIEISICDLSYFLIEHSKVGIIEAC